MSHEDKTSVLARRLYALVHRTGIVIIVPARIPYPRCHPWRVFLFHAYEAYTSSKDDETTLSGYNTVLGIGTMFVQNA